MCKRMIATKTNNNKTLTHCHCKRSVNEVGNLVLSNYFMNRLDCHAIARSDNKHQTSNDYRHCDETI